MKLTDNITGLQHIGIPTKDMDKTKAFYQSLGFEIALETVYQGDRVVFLKLHALIVETYESDQANPVYGAINHLSLNVLDVDDVYRQVTELGYKAVEGPAQLPYWTNGIKYFTIEGPNKERVEFSQYL